MFRTTRSLIILSSLAGISLTTTVAWAMGWLQTLATWISQQKVALMAWIDHPSISSEIAPIAIGIGAFLMILVVLRDL